MGRLYNFLSTSIIRGVFFFIPVGITIIIFKKVFDLMKKLLIGLDLHFTETTFWHVLTNNFIVIICILFLCFFAGLFSKSKWGTKFTAWLEDSVLSLLPGYELIKSSAEELLGVTNKNFKKVILLKHGATIQLGFKIEDVSATRVMVFIPGVPKPRSGSMSIVDKKQVIDTQLTTHQAFAIMRSIGKGSSVLLAKYINDDNALLTE